MGMIKINLLGEQKDRSASYLVHAVGLSAVLIVLIFAGGWISASLASEKSEVEFESSTKESQLAKLKLKTKKVDDLEQKKKLLGEKLEVIAKLKLKKQGPVRILDEIAQRIPEKAWLSSIVQKDETVELSGVGLDGQVVSDFVAKMRESKLVSDADNVKTEQILRDGVKLQEFSFPFTQANYFKAKSSEEDLKVKKVKKGK